jgi:hypothetical protein
LKTLEKFKLLRTQDLELGEGLIAVVDRKIGYFTVVSNGSVYKIGLHSDWYMEMDLSILENQSAYNPVGQVV